ncbi:S1 family peptidase [Haloechinothrix salitolerans]|uniref:S1 family peptidase n=1 Tax=Haloechinothrix salitolerans TaxID=926830 RepID=A0ABW2BXM3_9PSEU
MRHKRITGALFALVFAIASLLAPATADAIVGGIPANDEYAFSGSVQTPHKGEKDWHTCGITLITPLHALGAAHCQTNFEAGSKLRRFGAATAEPSPDFEDPSRFHVQFGSHDRLHGTEVRGVVKISKPPEWAKLKKTPRGEVGDLVILTLDRPITTIRPAGLAEVNPRLPLREIGWGLHSVDDLGKGPAPRWLHEADAPGVGRTSADCRGADLGVDELCVRKGRDVADPAKPAGECYGDSGSPALQRGRDGTWNVVGVVSRGPEGPNGEPRCATDAVMPKPTYYLNWIIQEVAAQGAQVRLAELPRDSGKPGDTQPVVRPVGAAA